MARPQTKPGTLRGFLGRHHPASVPPSVPEVESRAGQASGDKLLVEHPIAQPYERQVAAVPCSSVVAKGQVNYALCLTHKSLGVGMSKPGVAVPRPAESREHSLQPNDRPPFQLQRGPVDDANDPVRPAWEFLQMPREGRPADQAQRRDRGQSAADSCRRQPRGAEAARRRARGGHAWIDWPGEGVRGPAAR